MINMFDVLEEEEPPLQPQREFLEPLYLIHQRKESLYTLDDLIQVLDDSLHALDDLPQNTSILSTQNTSVLSIIEQYEPLDLSESILNVYLLESVPYNPPSVTDFTQYQTRRCFDTSISLELEPEGVQDYLRYLGERAKARWGSN